MSVVVGALCALYLILPLYTWIPSVRLLGRQTVALSALATTLDRNRPRYFDGMDQARPHALVFARKWVALSLAIAGAAWLFQFPLMLNLSAIVFALGVGHLILASTPPVVLYLACSGDRAVHTQLLLGQATSHRVVAFLKSAEVATSAVTAFSNLLEPGRAERGQLLTSDFRQKSDQRWQDAVSNVMVLVPLIILDGRDSSEAVREETALVHALGLEYKTLLIRDQHRVGDGELGRNPDSVGTESLRSLDEARLIGALPQMLLSRDTLRLLHSAATIDQFECQAALGRTPDTAA